MTEPTDFNGSEGGIVFNTATVIKEALNVVNDVKNSFKKDNLDKKKEEEEDK